MLAIEDVGNHFARDGFETYEDVGLHLGVAKDFFGGVKGGAFLAFHVDHLDNLHARVFSECVLVAMHAFFEVGLVRNGVDNDVGFAAGEFGGQSAARQASLVIVGADK